MSEGHGNVKTTAKANDASAVSSSRVVTCSHANARCGRPTRQPRQGQRRHRCGGSLIFDRSTFAKQAPEVWPLCGHHKKQVKGFAFVVRRRASGSRRRPTNGSRLREDRSPKYRPAIRRINRLTRSWWVAVNLGRLKLHCGTVGHSRPINEHRTGHLCELGFLRRFVAARRCGLGPRRRAGDRLTTMHAAAVTANMQRVLRWCCTRSIVAPIQW